MSNKPPQPPNSVPEEDLSLHENFAPIIAENGLIRQKKAPEVSEESLPAFLTRLDTLQDLVELRHAEQEEQARQQEHEQAVSSETPSSKANNSTNALSSKEDTPTIEEPVSDLMEPVSTQTIDSEQQQETSDAAKKPAESTAHIQETVPVQAAPSENFVEEVAVAEEPTSTELPTDLRELSTEIIPAPDKQTSLLPEKKEELTDVTRESNTLQETKTKKKSKTKRTHKKPSIKKTEKQVSAVRSHVPPKTPDDKSVQSPEPAPKRKRYWPWVIGVLLFLFLGGIGGLVPVEKIPILRELAYAMGFSKDDTSRMSFLRALLTWTDKTIGLPGNWGGNETEGTSLLAQRGLAGSTGETDAEDAAGLDARMARAGGKTSLIDIQALNALQRKKGYALDDVRGAVKLNPGQEEANMGPAVLRDGEVNVRTESGRVQGDVYFGSDTSAVNRDFKDGYDSVKTLARAKNPHIANGVPIDWLTNMTKRTMKTDMSIGGIDKELDSSKVAWGTDMADVGDKKEHRDLYHAWITSRMSKYTPNLMLKKGLADSAFLGADIPTTASNVLSFTGIQVDIESMNEDESAWKEYLEWEKQCKEELSGSGASGRIDRAINQYNDLFTSFNAGADPNVGFPTDCSPGGIDNGEKYTAFVGKIDKIINLCGTVSEGYDVLHNKCDMYSFKGTCDSAIRISYAQKWTGFKDYCTSKHNEEEEKWKEDWCAQNGPCENGVSAPPYPQERWLEDSKKYTQVEWNGGKTMEDDVKGTTGGTSDYFSAVVRAQLDENGNLIYVQPGSEENVQKTVYEGMQENRTL